MKRKIALLLTLALLFTTAMPLATAGAAMPEGRIAPMAAGFTGGAVQAPLYVLNDHTPIAVQFSASGLATNTAYYVKVRFTVGTGPSGSSNRGWTWNPSTHKWAQERDDWSFFPQVSSDASGNIPTSSGWTYAAFGDESVATTDFHVLITLSSGSSGSSLNASIVPTITVLDAKTNGTRVHNGVVGNPGGAGSRARLSQDTSLGVVYGLQKIEANSLDDDFDGVVDNEDYGPAGNAGDFRFGAPVGFPVQVNLNNVKWTPANGFVTGPADEDIAIGAPDTIAPTKPTNVVAANSGPGGRVHLTWDASSDASGVAGYRVYRWEPAMDGTQFTAPHVPVATVTGTSCDTTAPLTSTWAYEVRAFDDATNVSARSAFATVAVDADAPARVSDLAATAEGATSVGLRWTAPGDLPTGTPTAYDLRYLANGTLDDSTWASATSVPAGSPAASGTVMNTTVTGLPKGAAWAFGIRSRDAMGNWSPISNVVTVPGRWAGTDRYATAIAISQSTFATGSADTVVVATGKNYPDALAASGLCGSYHAPLLLTDPLKRDDRVLAEIERLGATKVLIVGGTPSVSSYVETGFIDAGLATERFPGVNRYDTARLIAERVHERAGSATAFVVRGDNFPDALSVSPYAYAEQMPVLLVKRDYIPAETSAALAGAGITDAVVVGDPTSVSTPTLDAVAEKVSGSVVRKGGINRYETAAAVVRYAVAQGWGDFGFIGVSIGWNFPDALGGGVAAGAHHGVLLLSNATGLPASEQALVTENKAFVSETALYGYVVPDAVRTQIENLIR